MNSDIERTCTILSIHVAKYNYSDILTTKLLVYGMYQCAFVHICNIFKFIGLFQDTITLTWYVSGVN